MLEVRILSGVPNLVEERNGLLASFISWKHRVRPPSPQPTPVRLMANCEAYIFALGVRFPHRGPLFKPA